MNNLSVMLPNSWVWIFKTRILRPRRAKNYQKSKWVSYLAQSCSCIQLSSRNIKINKNLSSKHPKLEKVTLKGWSSYLHPFFPPGGKTKADKLQWWKSSVFLVSWEKKDVVTKSTQAEPKASLLSFLGRSGLCTGQLFAINRSWLISRCCSGFSPPQLLIIHLFECYRV